MRAALRRQHVGMRRPDRTDILLTIGLVAALVAGAVLTIVSWF